MPLPLSAQSRQLAERITQIHLIYLSLLPAVATFLILGIFKIFLHPMLLLVVGTAAVGIVLAVSTSYYKASSNPWKNLIVLFDAPLWACATLFFGGSLATAITEDIIVEMFGILLGLFAVVLSSPVPTRGQRIASFFAVGLPLLGILYVIWQYAVAYIFPVQGRVWILVAAILQGTIMQFLLTWDDDVQRDSSGYIVVGVVAWLAAMFAGFTLGSP